MTNRGNLKFLIAVAAVFVFIFANESAFAAIVVENLTGTLSIKTPTGEVITVEPGQPIPQIPNGSNIELITGTADISASGTDVVNLLINNSTAVVKDGAKVSVTVELRTGDAVMNVMTGSVQVTQPDGTIQTISQGSHFSAPAPAPVSIAAQGIPGTDPAGNTGRQGDAQQGLVGGY